MKKARHYGPQTKQAVENFPFPVQSVSLELIYDIVQIKKAAALSHRSAEELPPVVTSSIIKACDEILEGQHDDQFVT